MYPKLIAFHLPQFHPIPENDEWWGKGFTEWTNVAAARSLFPGHDQPRLPADLGYYDLRLPEAQCAQAELARRYGIHGFCYWHYWFHGRRLLERPVNEILRTGEPDFPFCLAWANESWSRSWLGDNRQILVDQTYSAEDDIAHARWLADAFADGRYIRVEGRPLLLVYRPTSLPDARRTTDAFRREIERLGLPNPYLVGINAHARHIDMRSLGFDMTEHHEPQLGVLPGVFTKASLKWKVRQKAYKVLGWPRHTFEYSDARSWMDRVLPKYPHFRSYFVGWDNTARRGKDGIIITGATPDAVGEGLRGVLQETMRRPPSEQIVFLNAWNEWAEGMYLEPDRRYGLRRLEVIKECLDSVEVVACES
ncbi:glycoside hydrolase family 99-like domain-containing protein [Planctellipticum variicoloris]|uniref:glycoside hydrolase family 99-like domain-containing protein n=1 Tax=Planctellipticum variicoloris TaxID=3064265 RepID=UPI0030136972|nr:glycoside hydrolase family 99-like domain-containing protein [Planctomycetaceae bacterium SH412]